MADSEFQRPTLAENISMLRTIYSPGWTSATRSGAWMKTCGKGVCGGAAYGLRLHRLSGKNMLPDLCDESWLARHAAMKRVRARGPRLPAGICAGKVSAWPEGDRRECYSAR